MSKTTKTDDSNPVTRETLDARRIEQERRIADLRAERSAAILDGKAFDKSLLRDAEDELSATQEALAEFDRREEDRARAEAEAEASLSLREQWARARKRITGIAEERRAAIEDMELAIRSAAEAGQRAERLSGELHKALYRETGTSLLEGMPNTVRTRLGRNMSAVFAQAFGAHRFGEVRLYPGLASADVSWLGSEKPVQDQMERALATQGATIEAASSGTGKANPESLRTLVKGDF